MTMTAKYACDSGVSRNGASAGMGDKGARVVARPMAVATARGGRVVQYARAAAASEVY